MFFLRRAELSDETKHSEMKKGCAPKMSMLGIHPQTTVTADTVGVDQRLPEDPCSPQAVAQVSENT